MKKLILSTAALAFTASFAMAQDVVRMGTEGAYPPWNFLNDAAELNCEWVTNEWDSIIPNLVSGNYDVIIAGMSITDERDEVIDFTQNYTPPDPSAYVAVSDDVDVATGVIAAQTGTLQAGYIAESGAALIEFATPEETIAAVRNGEADAVLADKSFLA